jgi:GntR family transcriptional regulator
MESINWREELKIDHNHRVAMYYQIEENLKSLYKSGRLRPGIMLPSEWELSDIYQVSRLTVRQALKELEGQGLIKRKPGIGTFVSSPTSTNLYPSKLGFSQKIRNMGKEPSSKTIGLQRITGNEEVCEKLNLPAGSEVIELVRIRYADKEPIMLETAYLSAKMFPKLTETSLGEGSLYDYLTKEYNIVVASVEQTLYPMLLTKEQAKLLESEEKAPAMHSEVLAFTKDQVVVDYSISVLNGENSRFYFKYREEGN